MDLVFDLDGTLILHGQPLSIEYSDKIMDLSKNNRVIFASARPIRDMLPLLPTCFHNHCMIGCNGGQTYVDFKLTCITIPTPVVINIVNTLNKMNVSFVVDGSWSYYLSPEKHDFHDYILSLSKNGSSLEEVLQEGVTKILVLDKHLESVCRDIAYKHQEKLNFNTHSAELIFDISPKGANKKNTLEIIGVDFDNSLCVGNDHNDYDMLNASSYSIFVGSPEKFGNADYYCSIENLMPLVDEALRHLLKKNIKHKPILLRG